MRFPFRGPLVPYAANIVYTRRRERARKNHSVLTFSAGKSAFGIFPRFFNPEIQRGTQRAQRKKEFGRIQDPNS
jgi:hypothetical protein